MLLLTLCMSMVSLTLIARKGPPTLHLGKNSQTFSVFLEYFALHKPRKIFGMQMYCIKTVLFLKTKKLRLFSQVFHFHLKFVWIKNSYRWNFIPLSKIWSSWYTSLLFLKDHQSQMPQYIHKHWTRLNDADGEDDVDGDVFLVWSICSHEVRSKTETDRHTYQGKHQ